MDVAQHEDERRERRATGRELMRRTTIVNRDPEYCNPDTRSYCSFAECESLTGSPCVHSTLDTATQAGGWGGVRVGPAAPKTPPDARRTTVQRATRPSDRLSGFWPSAGRPHVAPSQL